MGDGYTDALVLEATGTWWWPTLGELSLYAYSSAPPPLPPWPHAPISSSSSSSFLDVSGREKRKKAMAAPSTSSWADEYWHLPFSNAMQEDLLAAASKRRIFFAAVTDAAMPMEMELSSLPSPPPQEDTRAKEPPQRDRSSCRAAPPSASPQRETEKAFPPDGWRTPIDEPASMAVHAKGDGTEGGGGCLSLSSLVSPFSASSRRTAGLSRLGQSTFLLEACWYIPPTSLPSPAPLLLSSLYVRVKNPFHEEILFLRVLQLPSVSASSADEKESRASTPTMERRATPSFLSSLPSLSAFARNGRIRIASWWPR